ncbi:hypothetical protein, partial [Paenibacillus popilliae]
MKTTPNYGLKLPGENDFYSVGDFNDNFNAVDAALTAAKEYANKKVASIHVPVKSVNNKTGDVRLTAA